MAKADESSNTNKIVRDRAVQWLSDTLKIAGPAILALCVMWVKVEAHSGDIDQLQHESEVRAARVMSIETALVGLQANQQADNSKMIDAVRRLEEVVKEVRTDVKELQRRP